MVCNFRKYLRRKHPGLCLQFIIFALSCFQCVQMGEVTIRGNIYLEAPIDPFTDPVNNDACYDYTNRLNNFRNQIEVSSGDLKTNPNNEGEFSLEGNITVGDILIRVEAEGFQTAYTLVNYDDIEANTYNQKTPVGETLRGVNNFYDLPCQLTSAGICPMSFTVPVDRSCGTLTLTTESNITILLLKEQNGSNFNRFSYAPLEE